MALGELGSEVREPLQILWTTADGLAVSPNTINAPWAFFKHGEAYRVIVAFEPSATLLCWMLFVRAQPSQSKTLPSLYKPFWSWEG